ncbi:MAG TPA: ABC transporter permease [Vicinamibacterales bacterium]
MSASPATARPRRRRGEWAGLTLVLVLLVAAFGAITEHFLSWTTAVAIANNAPEALIVAAGMTLVVVTGGIDLSVGSVLALSAAVMGTLLTRAGIPLPLAAAGAIATGAACGFINGWTTTRWRLPSFVVTLAMLEAARGATYLVTQSQTLYLGTAVDPITVPVAAGIRLPILTAIAIVIGGQLLLDRMVLGRHLLAVGANSEAARLAGIDPGRVRTAAFTMSGAAAGLAAVLQAGRLAASDPNAGIGLELEAIAAVVIGGASLAGGRGTIAGAALGALVIAVLGAGLAHLGVQEPTRRIVTGLVIAGAAIADYYRRRTESA